jgi:AraC family transcriptional regulator
MEARQGYGDGLAERFNLEKLNSHVTRSLRRGVLAVTQIKSDFPTTERTQPMDYDEAHLAGFQVWNSLDHELYQDGRVAKSQPFQSGETAFYDLRRSPGAYMRTPYHSLQFYLPHAALSEIAQQHDRRFSGDLRHAYGIAQTDPVLWHLGMAVLPALERQQAVDGLFLDHILHGVAAHVANAYGDGGPFRESTRGGLAQWQERRVKELMRANLGQDISLQQLADECGLSVAHFSRAFRQSTNTSPHRWMRERRIEKALSLLARSDLSLSDIAMDCGFADQSHFTRVFTKQVGLSPGQWRRENAGRA